MTDKEAQPSTDTDTDINQETGVAGTLRDFGLKTREEIVPAVICDDEQDEAMYWGHRKLLEDNDFSIISSRQGSYKSSAAKAMMKKRDVLIAPTHEFIEDNVIEKFWEDDALTNAFLEPINHPLGFYRFMEEELTEGTDVYETMGALRDAGVPPRPASKVLKDTHGITSTIQEWQDRLPDWYDAKTCIVPHMIPWIDPHRVRRIFVEESLTTHREKKNLADPNDHLEDGDLDALRDEIKRSIRQFSGTLNKNLQGEWDLTANNDTLVINLAEPGPPRIYDFPDFHDRSDMLEAAVDIIFDALDTHGVEHGDDSEESPVATSAQISHRTTETYIDFMELDVTERAILTWFEHETGLLVEFDVRGTPFDHLLSNLIQGGSVTPVAQQAVRLRKNLSLLREMVNYGAYVRWYEDGTVLPFHSQSHMFDLLSKVTDQDPAVPLYFLHAEANERFFRAQLQQWKERTFNDPGNIPEPSFEELDEDRERKVTRIRVKPPHSSQSALYPQTYIKDNGCVPKLRKTLDAIKHTAEIYEEVGVVTTKVMRELMEDELEESTLRNIKFLHYHNMMGRNKLKDVDCLHVVGQPRLKPLEFNHLYHTAYGEYPPLDEDGNHEHARRHTLIVDQGDGLPPKVVDGAFIGFTDQRSEDLYRAVTKSQVRDAMGRMRDQFAEYREDAPIIYWGPPVDTIDFDREITGATPEKQLLAHVVDLEGIGFGDIDLMKELAPHMEDHDFLGNSLFPVTDGLSEYESMIYHRIHQYLDRVGAATTGAIHDNVQGTTATISDVLKENFEEHRVGRTKWWSVT